MSQLQQLTQLFATAPDITAPWLLMTLSPVLRPLLYKSSHMRLQFSLQRDCFLTGLVQS